MNAKEIATALGPAGVVDAFILEAESGSLAAAECPKGGETVQEALNLRRQAAYDVARNIINGRDAALFVLRMNAFIDALTTIGAWDLKPEPRFPSPRKPTRKILKRRAARVMARGTGLPQIDTAARHRLRIALKDLRYGCDVVGRLFGKEEKAQAYSGKVSDLQEIPGSQNDVVAAKSIIASLSSDIGPEFQAILGFVLGWHAHDAFAKEKLLMKAWKNVRNSEGFWA